MNRRDFIKSVLTVAALSPLAKLSAKELEKGALLKVNKISVDNNKCVHCGLCINDCLRSAIGFDDNKIPHFVNGGETKCIGCQHCMAICPVGALSINGKNPADSTKIIYGNSDDMLSLIKSRRSVRSYKNESIPADKLEKITEMLAYPPTGGNVDCLHFSIIGTKEKMDEIRKAAYEEIMNDTDASPMIHMSKNAYQTGKDPIYRGAPSMIVASVNKSKSIPGCENADPIIALSYFELFAWTLGLGTLWCDMAVIAANKYPKVKSMLKIPEGYEIGFILLMGTPNVRYSRGVQKDTTNVSIIK